MHVMPAALVCSTSLLRIASWGLQHGDTANCRLVGKEGLRARYPVGHGLQHIVVANCQLVSEEGLQARNAGCPGWQRMDAANCQLVSKEGLQARILTARVCSAWTLRVASWSERRAFMHFMPAALFSTSWQRNASWSARRAFRYRMLTA